MLSLLLPLNQTKSNEFVYVAITALRYRAMHQQNASTNEYICVFLLFFLFHFFLNIYQHHQPRYKQTRPQQHAHINTLTHVHTLTHTHTHEGEEKMPNLLCFLVSFFVCVSATEQPILCTPKTMTRKSSVELEKEILEYFTGFGGD